MVRPNRDAGLADDLIALLGQQTDSALVKATLARLGLRSLKGEPESFISETICWYPKQSLRVDLYRGARFTTLTKQPTAKATGWYVGAVEFLAAGEDRRIKATYQGPLPGGLTMTSPRRAFRAALGTPQLTQALAGEQGQLVVWRAASTTTTILFDSAEAKATVLSYVVSITGLSS